MRVVDSRQLRENVVVQFSMLFREGFAITDPYDRGIRIDYVVSCRELEVVRRLFVFTGRSEALIVASTCDLRKPSAAKLPDIGGSTLQRVPRSFSLYQ
jgi:hypothetical protein